MPGKGKGKYEMREACFACTTPYQVIGAISIARSAKLQADLYIFGVFPGYRELAERARELGVFAHVFPVDCTEFSFVGGAESKRRVRLKIARQMLFCRKYVSAFLEDGIAYRTYYSASRAHVKNLFLRVLELRNPKLRICVYDDGLGSYLENSHVLRTSRTRKRVEKLLGWDLYDPSRMEIQLYLPEIAQIPKELSACPLKQMPRLLWTEPAELALLERLFGVTDTQQYDQKIILFDNVRGLKERKKLFEGIDACYQCVLEIAGRENVLFKPHPRSVEAPAMDLQTVSAQGVPMEVFYARMQDLDSRILITYNSTATYTPRMLFGKEPWVINLHRMIDSPLQEASETLYQTFRKTYSKEEKLSAPADMEELRAKLREALRGSGQP